MVFSVLLSFLFYCRFLARRIYIRLSLVSRQFLHQIRLPRLPYLGITEQKKAEVFQVEVLLPKILSSRENLRLITYGFLHSIEFFVLLPFPRSTYLYTSIARQPTISVPNPFAPAAVFGYNRTKNIMRRCC